MATFKALLLSKTEAGQSAAFVDFDEAGLMDGDVTVRVTHSTVNYKDGLAITGKGPVVRRWPMIPGIDAAGVVESSSHPDFKAGDAVVLNGWGTGETHLGAYAQKTRVKGDWLVPLPAGMSAAEAMAIGTAGYTAMLCLLALEKHGLTPAVGPAVVTGAAGASARSPSRCSPRRAGMSSPPPGAPRRRTISGASAPPKSLTAPSCRGRASRWRRSAGRRASIRSARTRSPTCSP